MAETVTLEEAKNYLRVSSNDEDDLINSILSSAENIVRDVARYTDLETEADEEDVSDLVRIAVMYTTAYLYEHREEADHSQLNLTLRSLLFGARREGF